MALAPRLLLRAFMQLELLEAGVTREIPVEAGAVFSFGGAAEDTVRLPGLLPGLVTVEERGGELFVTCARTLAVDGLWMPPGLRRLLLPLEVLELAPEVRLRRPAGEPRPRTDGTAAVLKGFLGGEVEGYGGESLPRLICLTGLDAGRIFPICGDEMMIGRGTDVAVRIRDRAVSRRHAKLMRRGAALVLTDLGTANGTYVNGARIGGSFTLEPRAVVEIGQTLMRYDEPVAATELPAVQAVVRAVALDEEPVEVVPERASEPELSPAPERRVSLAQVAFWALIVLGALLMVTGVGVVAGSAT